jgi:hypothetical protein
MGVHRFLHCLPALSASLLVLTFLPARAATTGSTAAVMSSPATGATLSGGSATFVWSAGTGASGYWLDVGATPGTNNIFAENAGAATSLTVPGLPTDGSTIYVRLWTQGGTPPNATWQYNDYTYTAASAGSGSTGTKAVMASPASGATLSGASVTFTWNAGAGASAYWLDMGSTAGASNIFGQNIALATSQTVFGLPTDGSKIYMRLWTLLGNVWQFNDYTYTAAAGNSKAVMSSPASGSTLSGASVTFTWAAGAGASAYWLDVGSIAGASNIFGQNIALATSQTVSGLPTDGNTIYVRLWTLLGNVWQYNDYTYTGAGAAGSTTGGSTGAGGGASTKAAMTSPALGATLSGSSITFAWNAVTGASTYWLDIGTSAGGFNLFSQGAGLATSQTVTGLPTDGSTIYLRLWTALGGTWQYNDYTYTAASAASDLAKGGTLPKSPLPANPLASAIAAPTPSAATPGSATIAPLRPGPALAPAAVKGSVVSPATIAPSGAAAASLAPAASSTVPLIPASGLTAPHALAAGAVAPQPLVPTAALTPRPFVAPGAAAPATAAALATTSTAPASGTAALLANFPVLSGATRIAFSSSRSPSTWQERGNYTVAVAPDSAGATYAQQLAAAGWNEISRSQSGDATAHTLQFSLDVQKDQTRGHVVLTQNAGGSGLSVTVTTLYPGNSAPALGTGATAAPATGATTSASDRGTGDPEDFPRLPGSIRTAFTSTSQKTSSQEVATYTAKCSPAAADASFDQNLPGAGWDELTRDENLNDASKSDQIAAKWQNGSRTAVIALSGSTAGGADIRVTVTTQASGTP